jgi:hypothetical protein
VARVVIVGVDEARRELNLAVKDLIGRRGGGGKVPASGGGGGGGGRGRGRGKVAGKPGGGGGGGGRGKPKGGRPGGSHRPTTGTARRSQTSKARSKGKR